MVGRVIEVSIHEYLLRKLLQAKQLKWTPASSDRVYSGVSLNGSVTFAHKCALDVGCARRTASGTKTEPAITSGTFAAENFRHPEEKVGNIHAPPDEAEDLRAHA